jgi:4'-phosphopantetheinyl transferase
MRAAACDLYFAASSMLQDRHLGVLSSVEADRRERYRTADARDAFTLGAVLLRAVAARRFVCPPDHVIVTRECDDCAQPHGRPRLPELGVEVSVSRSGEFAAVAITDAGSVGVDIEQIIDVDIEALLPTLCGPEEAAGIRRPEDFFQCWTRKESILKATGAGLARGMHRVVVTPPGSPPAAVSYDGSPINARMTDATPDRQYAAAATVLTAAAVSFTTPSAGDLLAAL